MSLKSWFSETWHPEGSNRCEYEFSRSCTNAHWRQWVLEWLKSLPDKRYVYIDYDAEEKAYIFEITTRHIANGKFLEIAFICSDDFFRNRRSELTERYHRTIIEKA